MGILSIITIIFWNTKLYIQNIPIYIQVFNSINKVPILLIQNLRCDKYSWLQFPASALALLGNYHCIASMFTCRSHSQDQVRIHHTRIRCKLHRIRSKAWPQQTSCHSRSQDRHSRIHRNQVRIHHILHSRSRHQPQSPQTSCRNRHSRSQDRSQWRSLDRIHHSLHSRSRHQPRSRQTSCRSRSQDRHSRSLHGRVHIHHGLHSHSRHQPQSQRTSCRSRHNRSQGRIQWCRLHSPHSRHNRSRHQSQPHACQWQQSGQPQQPQQLGSCGGQGLPMDQQGQGAGLEGQWMGQQLRIRIQWHHSKPQAQPQQTSSSCKGR